MKALLQRVRSASVSVNKKRVGAIQRGFLVFLGIHNCDTQNDADMLVQDILTLRVFPDDAKNMNRSLIDVAGELLIVPQFTLYANTKKGNRPSFTDAAPPDLARSFYEYVVQAMRSRGITTKTGIFGATMDVCLHNDGPVTIILETRR